MPADDRPQDDLRGLVVRGVGWMLASQAATHLLGLLTAIIVARLLGPREVGLAAEALVFGSLALVIVDFGFAAAIVQKPDLSETDKATAFWAGTALGMALTLIGVAASWPIADLYGEPRVQPLFAVLSLAFLFTAPGIVQGALLTREMLFRSLEVRTIIATVVSCAASIALAVAGAGPWAMVAQVLVISGVSTVLLWRASEWRPSARFSRDSLREMAPYASHVFGSRTLAWGTINLDNFLVGRFLGATALGAYTIAFSLMITPVNRIAIPLTQVFFPAFTRMRDPARIAGAWLRASRMIAAVVVPSMLGLIAVAPDLIDAVFGPEWHRATPVIQILAPVGLIQALLALNFGILQALDRTRTLFRYTLVASIATVAAFAAGLPWDLEGVATAYLIVTVAFAPVYLRITARAVGISPWSWVRSVAGVLQAGVAMLVVVFAARELLADAGLATGALLAVLVAIGAAAYVPLVLWRAPQVLEELRAVRRREPVDAPPADLDEGPATGWPATRL